MSKRDRILDAMQSLLEDNLASSASVSDIAKKAGIAKGGLYYYFKSKDEVFDALIQRSYESAISKSEELANNTEIKAIDKMQMLFTNYVKASCDSSQQNINEVLHNQEKALVHLKSLKVTVEKMSPIISDIINQGIKEGTFNCAFPSQVSKVLLSTLAFLLDNSIFNWSQEESINILKGLADMMEKTLEAPKDSFSFLFKI